MLPKEMKSPITGNTMPLLWEWREIEFRGDKFTVAFPFYRCPDTGEQFTTTESDGIWYNQMSNKYRKKYGIPYQDEIKGLRAWYGLSAAKMSLVMGFGPNQWRKYEHEEIPNVSNGRLIRSAMNPQVMLSLVESAKECMDRYEYDKVYEKVKTMVSGLDGEGINNPYEIIRVFAVGRGNDNGFAPLSLPKLRSIMLYLLESCCDIYYTKMNKLLFYADFLSYRERGQAMTGLSYRAMDYGPVPQKWDRIYSSFDDIEQETYIANGYEGIKLFGKSKADLSQFSQEEIELLDNVIKQFGAASSSELSEISHQEKAWKECVNGRKLISFEYAFELKGI